MAKATKANKVRALAFDFGASSGRAILGEFDGERVELQELHRFPNEPVEVNGALYWDVLRLFHELKQGLRKADEAGGADSVGVDTWGVDFGLLDKEGQLLANPLHYRSPLTDNAEEELKKVMPLSELYRETGIAFNKFNTLCQLVMLQKNGSAALAAADSALFMPDLFTYFLTGKRVCEHSAASTSQLLEAGKPVFSEKVESAYRLKRLFPQVSPSGTVVGDLSESIVRELRLKKGMPVIATLGHDTASAFMAAPVEGGNAAILSSGTWSLLGALLDKPVVSEEAAAAGYTNEIGFGGKVRFLRNIVGLWIIQECKRTWEKEGINLSFAEIAAGAEKVPAGMFFIDPDAEEFYSPHRMPEKVVEYCKRTGQKVPQTVFEIARCVYDSLARSYKNNLLRLEKITGKKFDVLHIVGGGANNDMLNRATAEALGIRVTAGPSEGTALGNILCQLIALGAVKDEAEAAKIVRNSCTVREYSCR